ncbi:MAG: fatty acid oxidation complex subunit alpha FadB [Colwellia sp.]|nr:fatty acid oxidation complex subunit alpha FadB [Colwellia sp.]
MFYSGNHMICEQINSPNSFLKVILDSNNSVNIINFSWLDEFNSLLDKIESCNDINGLIITSNKKDFCLGADIKGLVKLITAPEEHVQSRISADCEIYNRLERLPFPTVAFINGFCLGGGLELALCCDLRLVQEKSKLGFPETNLGIFPGYGGTVRLPRIIGKDNALSLILSAKQLSARTAVEIGIASSIVDSFDGALNTLNNAYLNKINWQEIRKQKITGISYTMQEMKMFLQYAEQEANLHPHRPEQASIVNIIHKASNLPIVKAIRYENEQFAKIAKLPSTSALINHFINNNNVNSQYKKMAKKANKNIKNLSVLGAGIMGGGIAYQSAINSINVIVKDINNEALHLAQNTFNNYLIKANSKKPLSDKQLNTTNNITYTTLYEDIKNTDFVIEAVTENPQVKRLVLSELENNISDSAIITSNTSTISINELSTSLKSPERFCGMHFFNPVPKMQLVEIIRSANSSDDTIACAVQVALKMGKTPIVVNDCPGFFINRVLFPYFAGFSLLVNEGVDFVAIDNIMTKYFGWPMGPAFLADVIGLDTLDHCIDVMAEGFPQRMTKIASDPIFVMYKNNRLGQKNNAGFYNFSKDKRGRPTKKADESYALLPSVKFKDPEIDYVIDRLMIPMLLEVLRCIDEGIINTSSEADLGLIMALGFPAFRGGPLQLIQHWGWDKFIKKAKQYQSLSPLYKIPQCVYDMAKSDVKFYPQSQEQLQ